MKSPKVKINSENCKACGYCLVFCNKANLKLGNKSNLKGFLAVEFEDKEGKCNSCALCAIMCPEAAIEVFKEDK